MRDRPAPLLDNEWSHRWVDPLFSTLGGFFARCQYNRGSISDHIMTVWGIKARNLRMVAFILRIRSTDGLWTMSLPPKWINRKPGGGKCLSLVSTSGSRFSHTIPRNPCHWMIASCRLNPKFEPPVLLCLAYSPVQCIMLSPTNQKVRLPTNN